MIWRTLLFYFLHALGVVHGYQDFVAHVGCQALGMNISLKETLPIPTAGMWDLSLAGFPNCVSATRADVGGGYNFMILFADRAHCGVEPKSFFIPSWVSSAKATLVLTDDNGSQIADSVSCVYKTRFETSIVSFSDEMRSQNLLYGGTLEEEATDVEATVHSGNAIAMDFFDERGRSLHERNVKMGDVLNFKIDVSESNQVTKVLPENCFFSAMANPDSKPIDGTLTFIRESCFNTQSGIVNQMLPQKMERTSNGTSFIMPFQAFYFSNYGQNLYVHCTILACVGGQTLCEPKSNCFSDGRRKRDTDATAAANSDVGLSTNEGGLAQKELVMTTYIVVENKRHSTAVRPSTQVEAAFRETVCMQVPHFTALIGVTALCMLSLLVAVACLVGRLSRQKCIQTAEKRLLYAAAAYSSEPPPYAASTITHF